MKLHSYNDATTLLFPIVCGGGFTLANCNLFADVATGGMSDNDNSCGILAIYGNIGGTLEWVR